MKKPDYSLLFLLLLFYNKQVFAIDSISKKNIQNEVVISQCIMPKINQQVQVIGTMKDTYLRTVISPLEGRQKSSISNSSLVEGLDSRKICPSEGFGHLSCSDSSFTILQNTCERRYLTLEILVFIYNKNKSFFNLFSYTRESVDRLAENKDPKIKIYSVNEIGEVAFEKTTRGFLIDLINKTPKTTF